MPHSLLPDTIGLWRNREDHGSTAYSASGLVDEVGTHDLSPAGDPLPSVTWGPNGSAQRGSLARAFTATSPVPQRLVSGTIDANFRARTYFVTTWEVLFRLDDMSAENYLMAVGGPISAATEDDVLFRLSVTAGGAVTVVWEAEDNATVVTTTATPVTLGTWHVLHVTRRPDSLNSGLFEVQIFLDGALVEAFDSASGYTSGTGARPGSPSGTDGVIMIGAGGDDTLDAFVGAIASVRVVFDVLDSSEIQDAVDELFLAGDTAGAAADIGHWRLNERPHWFDEGDLGLHVEFTGTRYEGSDPSLILDLVHDPLTDGRAQRFQDTPIEIDPRVNGALLADRGYTSLAQVFNDDLGTPEWTMMASVLLPAAGPDGSYDLVAFEGAAGETLAENEIAGSGFTAGLLARLDHERGAGSDVSATGAAIMTPATALDTVHLAVRRSVDDGDPSMVIDEWFVNGVQTASAGPVLPPQGGTDAANRLLLFAGGFDGWVQGVHLVAAALSDSEIAAQAALVVADANLGFEVADAVTPGFPASWAVTSTTSTEFAGWGLLGLPIESFEREWSNTDAPLSLPAVALADFGAADVETFEDWFASSLVLPAVAAAVFDGETVEDFEESWDNDAYDVVIGTLEFADFGSADVETFEDGWDNDAYVSAYVGIGTDLLAALFGDAGLNDVEDFESVKLDQLCAVTPSTDTVTCTAHGFSNAQRVEFRNEAGRLPSGINAGYLYHVVGATANTLQISPVTAGAAVDLTDFGFGAHYVRADPANFWRDQI